MAKVHFPVLNQLQLLAMDLTTGNDFMTYLGRAEAERRIDSGNTKVLILSPPCTMYSKRMLINLRKMSEEMKLRRWREAHTYLDWCMSLCQKQARKGNYYIFEHPDTASSWQRPSVQAVQQLPNANISRFDMCRMGMLTPFSNEPMQKPTKILSNLPAVHHRLNGKRCTCTVPHVIIQGSQGGVTLSRHAQVYPPKLCATLCLAVQEELAPDEALPELPANLIVT